MGRLSVVILIVFSANMLHTHGIHYIEALRTGGERTRVVHREFQHEGGEQISEDVVLQPALQRVSIDAHSRDPRHHGHIQAVFDFKKDVAGFAVVKLRKCFVLEHLAESGVAGEQEEEEDSAESTSVEDQETLRNHVVLTPDEEHTTADPSQLPAELQHPCQGYLVYKLTRPAPAGEDIGPLGGEDGGEGNREARFLSRLARHHSRKSHSRSRSRSRSRGSHGSHGSHGGHHGGNQGGYYPGFNPNINFNVGGCVAIFSSEVCVTENNYYPCSNPFGC